MDISRVVFLCTTAVLVLSTTFGAGIYSAASRNSVFLAIQDGVAALDRAFAAAEETAMLVPEGFLQPARREGEGVTVNRRDGDDGALVLMSGFFEGDNQLRLVRRDGSVVARWPVLFSELFPEPGHVPDPPATDWNVDTHGALALPDGSVLFNFEYYGLVKLDRCGEVDWTLAHRTHHSVEPAADGGFWVPDQRVVTSEPSSFPPFQTPYKEDLILRVSESGEVVTEISVPELMYENGLETLLTANGREFFPDRQLDDELVHLNKIAELSPGMADAFPGFDAGDLALSLRNQNLVMVLDPRTRRVKWYQVGPWRRQHDPEFGPDGSIVVFNNNTYWNHEMFADGSGDPNSSEILRVDPVTGRVETLFGDRPGQAFLSVIRGKVELLDGGGFLITDFEGGRVIETDASGSIVWEYINRYDADNVAEVTEARLYPEGYFSVEDWSCPPA